MDVITSSPLQLGSILWQSPTALPVMTVVCKATFQLHPRVSPLSEYRQEIISADQFWDESDKKSLRHPNELVPHKPWVDFFVIGQAFAPGGNPTHMLTVRAGVGEYVKTLEVYSDRMWSRAGQLQRGSPFTRMPLRWERASGGPSTANPIGIEHTFDARGLLVLPNFQMPGTIVQGPSDRIAPAGLGPIPPNWLPRWSKLGRLASVWNPWSWHLAPLPEGLDASFFNAAPPDQQLRQFAGTENIFLENLHPEYPNLVTRLARVVPKATAKRPDGQLQDIPLRCDTLCVDTDEGILTAVWRGFLALARANEAGIVTITAEIEETHKIQPKVIDPLSVTNVPTRDMPRRAALPFAPGTSSAATPAPSPLSRPIVEFRSDPAGQTIVKPNNPLLSPAAAQPLPFRSQKATPAPVAAAAPPVPAIIPPSFIPPPLPAPPAPEDSLSTPPSSAPPASAPLPPKPEFIGLSDAPSANANEPASAPPAKGSAAGEGEAVRLAVAEKRSLKTVLLSGLDLSNIDFQGCDLSDCDLSRSRLSGCNFAGVDLMRARLSHTDLSGADFSGAKLGEADLSNSTGLKPKFESALLEKANLSEVEFQEASFSRARLGKAILENSILSDCTFDKSVVAGSSWDEAVLEDCSFQNVDAAQATFAEVQWTRVNGQGSNFTRAVLVQSELNSVNFSEAILTSAYLSLVLGKEVSFDNAKMDGIDLRLSKLAKSSFVAANLSKAHADNADFSASVLSKADLRGAAFRECDFSAAQCVDALMNEETDFRGADLTQLNARGAELLKTKLQGAKLPDTAPRIFFEENV